MKDLIQGFMREHNIAGLTFAITQKDGAALVGAMGVRCVEDPSPMRAELLVRIASVAKPITAATVLKLQ